MSLFLRSESPVTTIVLVVVSTSLLHNHNLIQIDSPVEDEGSEVEFDCSMEDDTPACVVPLLKQRTSKRWQKEFFASAATDNKSTLLTAEAGIHIYYIF